MVAVEERVTIEETTNDSPSNTFFTTHHHRNRCCFQLPCFGPGPKPHLTLGGPNSGSTSSSASFWDKIRVGESDNRWWARPITAFKKIREWSEIVAGPKWKTFIRRFNRNGGRHRHGHVSAGKFQYDPLSYALNFDEGQGQNGHFEEECYVENYPDFSSRFSARPSVELGKGAPAS
ncbi:hypothetical protein RND81_10G225600 [Saponaria officinalis]|uniref:Uncharacterized protein n=1 Tax=Saponaria officinalis TaxID=3572 RepID=A0AAW1I6R9_SAPOF